MSDLFRLFPRWALALALIASFGLALVASPVSAQGDLTNDTTSDASDDIPPDGDDLADLTNDTGDDGDDVADLTNDTGDDGDDAADLTNDTSDDAADGTGDVTADSGDDDTGDAADGGATDDGAEDDGDDATEVDSVNELPDTGATPVRDSGMAEFLILASVSLAVIGTYTWMKRREHTS